MLEQREDPTLKRPTPPVHHQPRRTVHGALGALIGFVVVSVVAGLVASLAVAPAVALTGAATSGTIGAFQSLPGYLEVGELMQKSDIYAGDPDDPVLLASFYDQNRIEVGADQVAQSVKDALVTSEDPRFYEHGGIDLQGTLRAIAATYIARGDTQGGSSITQQYVKNVLVQKAESITDSAERQAAYDDVTAPTPERKLREMRLAIGLEKESSKDDILLGYLNIALFGGTVYGIEAAANYYYGIPASQLTTPQAAALIAIVNNPEKFRFDRPDDPDNGEANGYAATTERRDYILDRMLEHGTLTQAEHDRARASPVDPTITQPSTGCQTAGDAAYFCDYVTRVLRSDQALGESDDERYATLKRGGLKIYTTLDLDLQATAKQSLDAQVPSTDSRFDVGATAVAVEPGTGRVVSMVQNKDYSQDPDVIATGPRYSALNLNVDAALGGGDGFQTGSTYKVFTLADWLVRGHSLFEQVDARQRNWTGFADSCLGTQNYASYDPKGGWTPSPVIDALTATVFSINTGFIAMAHELDLCDIRTTAEAFGVHRADGSDLQQSAATVLGTNEIAPLTMAVAYAGIANDGVTCSAIAIERIETHDGGSIDPPVGTCARSVPVGVSHTLQYALRQVVEMGTATLSDPGNGTQHLAKTGTTDRSSDTWVVGASRSMALAVWVGSITALDSEGTRMDLESIAFDSGDAMSARHRIFRPIMAAADVRYPALPFTAPPPSSLETPTASVPDVAGLTQDRAVDALDAAGFTLGDVTAAASAQPIGRAAGTSPAAGSVATRGSVVGLQLSAGTPPAAVAPSG